MKTVLIASLAAAAAAIPALAQSQSQAPVAPAPQARAMQHLPHANRVHTRAEAATKVRDMFARLDSNRDGFVTREEGQAGRAMLRQHRKGAAMAAGRPGAPMAGRAPMADRGAMFDRMDANRDGMISRDEFSRAPAMRQRVTVGQDGQRMGARGAMGMRGGMMGLGGWMFELADANRDNRVSLQEATAAAMRHFDTADANRDGQVTRDERRQARERMRAQRNPG